MSKTTSDRKVVLKRGQNLIFPITRTAFVDFDILFAPEDSECCLTFNISEGCTLVIKSQIGTNENPFPNIKFNTMPNARLILQAEVYVGKYYVNGDMKVVGAKNIHFGEMKTPLESLPYYFDANKLPGLAEESFASDYSDNEGVVDVPPLGLLLQE